MNFLLISGMIFVNGAHVYILTFRGSIFSVNLGQIYFHLQCTYTGGFMLSIMIVSKRTIKYRIEPQSSNAIISVKESGLSAARYVHHEQVIRIYDIS